MMIHKKTKDKLRATPGMLQSNRRHQPLATVCQLKMLMNTSSLKCMQGLQCGQTIDKSKEKKSRMIMLLNKMDIGVNMAGTKSLVLDIRNTKEDLSHLLCKTVT